LISKGSFSVKNIFEELCGTLDLSMDEKGNVFKKSQVYILQRSYNYGIITE
jgi:hypothetical protein